MSVDLKVVSDLVANGARRVFLCGLFFVALWGVLQLSGVTVAIWIFGVGAALIITSIGMIALDFAIYWRQKRALEEDFRKLDEFIVEKVHELHAQPLSEAHNPIKYVRTLIAIRIESLSHVTNFWGLRAEAERRYKNRLNGFEATLGYPKD